MFIKRAFFTFALLALHSLLWAGYSFAQSSSSSGLSTATALARAALPRGSARDFGPEIIGVRVKLNHQNQ